MKFCIFVKPDKNSILNCTVARNTVIKNAHTAFGFPNTISFLCLVCFGISISAGLIPSLPASAVPFFPLGAFSPFSAGAFLGLGSGFGEAGLADDLVDLLCGLPFTLALSPLATPSALPLGMMVTGRDVWTGHGDAAA